MVVFYLNKNVLIILKMIKRIGKDPLETLVKKNLKAYKHRGFGMQLIQ